MCTEMKRMNKAVPRIIENGVFEAIFERGWVEQTPEQFIQAAKEEITPYFKKMKIEMYPEKLNELILDELARQLGDEYDVNIYRLQFFPSETPQEYDVWF